MIVLSEPWAEYEEAYCRLWRAEIGAGVDTGRLVRAPAPRTGGHGTRGLAALRSEGMARDESDFGESP